jgi:hypothetical protein
MNHKEARTLRDTLMIIGFIVMLTGYLFGIASTIIGAVIMFSCLVPDFLYNKCPHCKKRLGRNEGTFCQHCGGRID